VDGLKGRPTNTSCKVTLPSGPQCRVVCLLLKSIQTTLDVVMTKRASATVGDFEVAATAQPGE
jgi:hypothetical protein